MTLQSPDGLTNQINLGCERSFVEQADHSRPAHNCRWLLCFRSAASRRKTAIIHDGIPFRNAAAGGVIYGLVLSSKGPDRKELAARRPPAETTVLSRPKPRWSTHRMNFVFAAVPVESNGPATVFGSPGCHQGLAPVGSTPGTLY